MPGGRQQLKTAQEALRRPNVIGTSRRRLADPG